MLGPAPVVDFDGTVARLPVPWAALRRTLGVERMDDLWQHAPQRWPEVTATEVRAAAIAEPVAPVCAALHRADGFAVLTSNSEDAVHAFLARDAALRARVVVVVGRETLGAPKTRFETFAEGFDRCVAATAAHRGADPIVYVGDQPYEIDFAARLGARAVHVSEMRAEEAP